MSFELFLAYMDDLAEHLTGPSTSMQANELARAIRNANHEWRETIRNAPTVGTTRRRLWEFLTG